MKTATEVNIDKFPISISKSDRILVLGSCFASNIGSKLAEDGYDVLVNPFGTLFNPASVASSILRLASGEPFTDSECVKMGAGSDLWCSFSHYTKFARPTREEFLRNANEVLASASDFFRTCNKVIITFGTAYVFRFVGSRENDDVEADDSCNRATLGNVRGMGPSGGVTLGVTLQEASASTNVSNRATLGSVRGRGPSGGVTLGIVSNCLKRPAKEFDRFRLTVDEIVEMWNPLLDNELSGKDVIFTVSPIRHMADTAHGNQLSKATLLMAEDVMMEGRPNCAYFPSYEIVLDELRDYRWYADDLVHPSDAAIELIWSRFQTIL